MKLAKVRIENFRQLGSREKPLEVNFTDALGRVRDFTVLVGPNASGKTTILDAIALALASTVGMASLRRDLKVSPRTIVRRGAINAQVTCWLRFSAEELAATREIFRLAELSDTVPEAQEVKLTWTYPSPAKPSDNLYGSMINLSTLTWQRRLMPVSHAGHDPGVIRTDPENGWVLLHGREQAARLLATGRADWSWFHRVGGVFTFDQERTGLAKTISRQVWNVIEGTAEAAQENEDLRTTDPRTILIDLALQSLVPPIASNGKTPDEFHLIQERYGRVCAPRRMVGAVRDELGAFDVQFKDGENEYAYEGLSSGEKNVLLLLIRFVAERMHQSIVLIDEVELNQHPLWQRALVDLLPRLGDGNQIIATTHSPYLRGAVPPSAVLELGGTLGETQHAGA